MRGVSRTRAAAAIVASAAMPATAQFDFLSIPTEGTFADPPDPSDADVATVLDFTGPLTQLDFSGIASGTILTDQFADLGVTWTDGDTLLETDFFFPDQVTIEGQADDNAGNDESVISFALPQTAFAVQFSGDLAVQLFSGGEAVSGLVEIQETSVFPTIIRSVAGIVSDTPFDSIVLTRINAPTGEAFYQEVFVQNVVPAPGPLTAVGLATVLAARRRR